MGLDITRIRGLCFDVDGTLSDTDDRWVARFSRSLRIFSPFLFGRSPDRVARRIVMSIEAPGNAILGIPDRWGVDSHLMALMERINRLGIRRRQALPQVYSGAMWLIPGVREALAALHPYYPMCVVSARDERSTLGFLEQNDLLPYFCRVITALTCEHTKPYPDPILYAAAQMGVLPGECLMIGDTTVDMHAARAAGAQKVGVLCGFGEEAELLQTGADLILPTTALLPEVLLPENPAPQRMTGPVDEPISS